VLNAENLSGYSNNATQSNQIQGGSSASGLFTKKRFATKTVPVWSALFILIIINILRVGMAFAGCF
jgi:hypothetical protein